VNRRDPFGLAADTVHWDYATDEQREWHARMMETDRDYAKRYETLHSDPRHFYVVGEDQVPGGCRASGFGFKRSDGGDWCGMMGALTAPGLGDPLFYVTRDMERVLGVSITGGIVLLPSAVPVGYSHWGEALNHELMHLSGIPKGGRALQHPNTVFCTIPGRCP
jgi:hypothetical protein